MYERSTVERAAEVIRAKQSGSRRARAERSAGGSSDPSRNLPVSVGQLAAEHANDSSRQPSPRNHEQSVKWNAAGKP